MLSVSLVAYSLVVWNHKLPATPVFVNSQKRKRNLQIYVYLLLVQNEFISIKQKCTFVDQGKDNASLFWIGSMFQFFLKFVKFQKGYRKIDRLLVVLDCHLLKQELIC